MSYWIAYLVVALLSWAFRAPWLALAVVFLVALRRRLPDPVAWLASAHASTQLEKRVEMFPGDLVARRSLARVYLHLHRPERAASLLEEAIAKGMVDDEMFYLLGLARLRAGRAEEALAPLVRSVEMNDRLLLGEAYFTAGEALAALGRHAEAEDAFERGLKVNSSHIGARVRVGDMRKARGEHARAKLAYADALTNWRELPDYLRWSCTGDAARALRAKWLG